MYSKRKFTKPSDSEIREKLSKEEFEVTQNAATEAPFSHPFDRQFKEGIYVDVVTGEPLFSSKDKFNSGCGWPAFSQAIDNEVIKYIEDTSHGMRREEVKSATGDSHLGHVFNDGPKEAGGMRYCINGAALRFIPKDKMEEEGYGAWLSVV